MRKHLSLVVLVPMLFSAAYVAADDIPTAPVTEKVIPDALTKVVALLPADVQRRLVQVGIDVPVESPALREMHRRESGPVAEASIDLEFMKNPDQFVGVAIHVTSWSATFKRYQKGNRKALLRLASDLIHEVWHVDHGYHDLSDEPPAYDEQVKWLIDEGAPEDLIQDVQRSRDYILLVIKTDQQLASRK